MPKASVSRAKIKRIPTVVVRGEILSSWLTISNYTKSQLAAELGISRGRVSQLLTSREEPSAHLIAKPHVRREPGGLVLHSGRGHIRDCADPS